MASEKELSYEELLEQAQELMARAEEVRKKELGNAIQEILEKMAKYQISLEDLRAAQQANKPRRTIKKPSIKYRGSAGQTWSGRGRAPQWLQAELDKGRSKDEFLVPPEDAPA